jgi:hypothetical protein
MATYTFDFNTWLQPGETLKSSQIHFAQASMTGTSTHNHLTGIITTTVPSTPTSTKTLNCAVLTTSGRAKTVTMTIPANQATQTLQVT